jgi:hypothetical protein
LAYRPVIEDVDQTDDLLREATERFVFKFAGYKAIITSTLNTLDSAVVLNAWGLPANLIPSSSNASKVTLSFEENSTTGVIKSMF